MSTVLREHFPRCTCRGCIALRNPLTADAPKLCRIESGCPLCLSVSNQSVMGEDGVLHTNGRSLPLPTSASDLQEKRT